MSVLDEHAPALARFHLHRFGELARDLTDAQCLEVGRQLIAEGLPGKTLKALERASGRKLRP